MGSLLSRITSTAQFLPPRTFFYAREKWGKSSIFAHDPGAVFFMTRGETGLVELIAGGRVPNTPHFAYDEADPPTWDTLRDAVRELIEQDHAYKRLVIDTANGAEILLQEQVRRTQFKNSHAAFASYGKGWDACRVQWLGLLQDLDELRSRRKMAITFLAHTKVKKFDDPTQDESYDKYTPACQEKLWDLTHKWSDIICFGHFKTQVYETDSGKTKASKDVRRVICFNQSPTWEAGNRYGITGEIDVSGGAGAGYALFEATVAKARAANVPAPAVTKEQFLELITKKGKTWANALAAIDAKQNTQYVANKTPFAQVATEHIAGFARWLDKQPDAAKAEQPASPPPPPPPVQASAPEPEPTHIEYPEGDEPDRGDADEGPDVDPEDNGIDEPPLRTMPAAERRTEPPKADDAVRARDEVLATLGEIGVDWPLIRESRGAGEGVAALCGFEPHPGLKIGQLDAAQMVKLRDWCRAKKVEKDKRKRTKTKVEAEVA